VGILGNDSRDLAAYTERMIREKLHAYARHVEDNGGEEWVFGFVAEGHPMRKVAELTGCSSRGLLYSWIKHGGEERKKHLHAARKISAHCLAEDAGEVLDDLADSQVITSAEVSLASSRARYKQWLAGMRNKEDYGEKSSGVEINLSVGELHLDALRRHSAEAIAARTEDVVEADYEVENNQSVAALTGDRANDTLPDELNELM